MIRIRKTNVLKLLTFLYPVLYNNRNKNTTM